jgi:ankyrin repeat protein
MIAAEVGRHDIAEMLICAGADPDPHNKQKRTALMLFAIKGKADIV